MSATAAAAAAAAYSEATEIVKVRCECCALTEECTPGYVAKIRERHHGRWICGLCAEAVKDEMYRSERVISSEEALNRHMSFSKSFRSSSEERSKSSIDDFDGLISAMKQLLRRSLGSPRAPRSTPASPRQREDESRRSKLARSGSCF